MNDTLKQNITEELTLYLNRTPTENEIMNAQADINIMSKVQARENAKLLDRVNEIGKVATPDLVELEVTKL